MDMNDRSEQPNRKQTLPEGDGAKCALAYSLLVENFEHRGAPPEVAEQMAKPVVAQALEDTKAMRKISKLRYDVYSTVHNN